MANAIQMMGLGKMFRVHHDRPVSIRQYVDRFIGKSGQRSHVETFWALRAIDLEIHHGETFALIGPNGSGKSTLLRLVAGTTEPTEGEINVHGRIAPLIELGLGFSPELTGEENVHLNASFYGLRRLEIQALVLKAQEFAGLGDFFDVPVKHYSSGMYARLAFATAIHLEPEILLVDEVLAVGDQNFKKKCLAKMEEIRDSGTTIVLVSHDAEQVRRMADRAAWIDGGRLRKVGDASDVLDDYAAGLGQS